MSPGRSARWPILLVISGWHASDLSAGPSGTVAALVGMVPQGLVLLTSVAFGVAAVTPGPAPGPGAAASRGRGAGPGGRGVPGQDRHPHRRHHRLRQPHPLGGPCAGRGGAGALADDENRNATLAAVGQAFPPPQGWPRQAPCRSPRRASGARPASPARAPGCWEHRRWCCRAASRTSWRRPPGWPPAASRVLVLARAAVPRWTAKSLPPGLRAAAFVLLAERLRSGGAAETIAYFAAQGVALKVISGDSPLTVSAVAARVGPARRGRARRRAGSAGRPRRAGPPAGGALGLRPGEPAAETGDGHRPAGPRAHRGDDRRRRQRRAGPQARRHRHRHGLAARRRPGRSPSWCCSTAGSPRCPASSPKAAG